MAFDAIGHLAWRGDGTPFDGLCHCAAGESHPAGDDKPAAGTWHLDFGGATLPCPVCGRPIPGSGHRPECMGP